MAFHSKKKMSFRIQTTLLFLFFLCLSHSAAQLDNENAILGVYLDKAMVRGQIEAAEALVNKSAAETSAAMEKGSLSVRFLKNADDALAKDLVGLLSVTNCEMLSNITDTLTAADKLVIGITTPGCMRMRQDSAATFPLVSGKSDVLQLIADLRDKNTLTWRDIVVIHDGYLDSYSLDLVMSRLTQPMDTAKDISTLVFNISNSATAQVNLRKLFQELGPRPGEPRKRNFLAIVSKDKVQMIQELANSTKLMSPKYQWFFMIPDTDNLNFDMMKFLATTKDGDNLAFAYNMSESSVSKDCKNGYTCYLDSLVRQFGQEFSKALQKELEQFYQVSEEEWEETKPSARKRAVTVINAIKSLQLNGTSCSVCSRWGLQAVEVKAADRFELLSVADWRPSTGLMLFDDLFPHVTGGFRRRVIPVTSLNFPPWQIFTKKGEFKGLIFEVLKELGNRLNFTFTVIPPADSKWGNKSPQGQWDGMMQMVINKEVMLGAAAFTVSTERMTAVNFTATIDYQPYTFMISRPKELSRVLIFIEPFANHTWILIGLTTLVMGPILYLVNRFSPYYEYHDLNNGRGLFQLQNCSWFVYGAILQQGDTNLPLANSGRMVAAFWWIFVIVVVTTYSGNLVAFLTFPQIENAVSTLDDLLAQQSHARWGFVEGTVLEEYFHTAEGKFKQIGLRAEVLARRDDTLYDRIRKTDFAFLEWKTNLLFIMKEQFLKTGHCDFSLGSEEFYFENVAMPVPKDSPYLDHFNREVKRMQLAGLIQKWKQDYWPTKDQCSSTAYGDGGGTRTVSLSDMQGSFFILGMGGILAAFVIIVECVMKKRLKHLPNTPVSTKTIVKSFGA